MHGGLVLLALLGGLEVFGLVGLIAGPLCFSFFLALLRIYRQDFVHGGHPTASQMASLQQPSRAWRPLGDACFWPRYDQPWSPTLTHLFG